MIIVLSMDQAHGINFIVYQKSNVKLDIVNVILIQSHASENKSNQLNTQFNIYLHNNYNCINNNNNKNLFFVFFLLIFLKEIL